MRLPFLSTLVLAFFTAVMPANAADWLLVAVPQSTGKDGGQVLDITHPFRVILTNATNHNLKVWKEGCSWGYFNLSFEFTGKDGKIVKVAKNTAMSWTRNGPASEVVQPGCAFFMTVNFTASNALGKKEWIGVTDLRGDMTMKALYNNDNEPFPGTKEISRKSDAMTKHVASVWAGQVKSAPISVMIAR